MAPAKKVSIISSATTLHCTQASVLVKKAELKASIKRSIKNLNKLKSQVESARREKAELIKTRDEFRAKCMSSSLNTDFLCQTKEHYENTKCEAKVKWIIQNNQVKDLRERYLRSLAKFKCTWEQTEKRYKELPLVKEADVMKKNTEEIKGRYEKLKNEFEVTRRTYKEETETLFEKRKTLTLRLAELLSQQKELEEMMNKKRELERLVQQLEKQNVKQIQEAVPDPWTTFKAQNILPEASMDFVDITAFDNYDVPMDQLEVAPEVVIAPHNQLSGSPQSFCSQETVDSTQITVQTSYTTQTDGNSGTQASIYPTATPIEEQVADEPETPHETNPQQMMEDEDALGEYGSFYEEAESEAEQSHNGPEMFIPGDQDPSLVETMDFMHEPNHTAVQPINFLTNTNEQSNNSDPPAEGFTFSFATVNKPNKASIFNLF